MRPVSLRRISLLAALALLAPTLQAQSVEEVIAKNIEAKGGAATLKSTTSVRTVTRGTMQGAEISATTSSKRPFFFRNEAEMAGQTMIQGFDGETFWMAMGTMPARPLSPGPQVEALKQSSQIDSPLLDYKDKGIKVALGEPVTEEGRKLHHLIVTPKTGPTLHYYIDAQTHLESKMVIEGEGGQSATMELRFSDYRTVDGRTVPFTTTQYVNGTQVVQMKLEKVEFNIPLDAALFRMPKQ